MPARIRTLVPNAVTGFSLSCGLLSMVMSVQANYTLAAWFVLWGVLLDKLDGTAARLLRATSAFGVEFDSFADFVVFGTAPATLFYLLLSEQGFASGMDHVLAGAACLVHVLAVAVRLARFNIASPPLGEALFHGVPTTLVGAVLASSFLSWEQAGRLDAYMRWVPVALLTGAVLMVSNLLLPKLRRRKSRAINAIQVVGVITAYVFAPLRMWPEYLLGLAVVYLVVGLAWGVLAGRAQLREAAIGSRLPV